MKIPSEVKIAGHTYEVRFVLNLMRDTGNRGQVTWHTLLIEIDDNMPIGITATTFLHECIHIVDKHFCAEQLSETETIQLSEGLFQLLTEMGLEFTAL